jgi:hypothetical protein
MLADMKGGVYSAQWPTFQVKPTVRSPRVQGNQDTSCLKAVFSGHGGAHL